MAEISTSRKKAAAAALLLAALALAAVFFKAFLDGSFDSVASLRAYMRGFGALGPAILTALQAFQVVVPVLRLNKKIVN